ncbi:hypothetical protein JOL62DRAFT_426803 [Phyllosticta paracitricarpa]|uniref:Uncharacterized protein n=1 Tax=Phyllosticta paracitricarpa TaxID=2016321 RepID=A0ABR1NCZ3_9PEZI
MHASIVSTRLSRSLSWCWCWCWCCCGPRGGEYTPPLRQHRCIGAGRSHFGIESPAITTATLSTSSPPTTRLLSHRYSRATAQHTKDPSLASLHRKSFPRLVRALHPSQTGGGGLTDWLVSLLVGWLVACAWTRVVCCFVLTGRKREDGREGLRLRLIIGMVVIVIVIVIVVDAVGE